MPVSHYVDVFYRESLIIPIEFHYKMSITVIRSNVDLTASQNFKSKDLFS